LRVDLAEAPLHHCVAITRLITTLPRAGWLVEEVEPGLHYVVVDCARGESHLDEVFQPLQSKERFLVAWCVNEIKRCQLAYYPFPLCINDAEALFRFYNGEFVAFVFVDVNYVNSALAHRSLSIKMTEKDEYPWEVVPTASHVGWGEGPLYLSWHILSRLAGEFLRLDWFLENVVANNAKASVTYARDLAARIATHH